MILSPALRTERSLATRPIGSADMEFLYQVYASTRQEELAQTDWSEAQKKAFLEMQFNAQHQHYQTYFLSADFCLLLLKRTRIGRLYLYKTADDLHIIDITLLPAWRGQGLGTAILQDLQAQAQQANQSLSIYVEIYNPALRLYNRLGFKTTGEEGVYYKMEWNHA